jgi:hypothetical protein
MTVLKVERVGGFAGFGGPGSHIRSQGEIDSAALADADRARVEALFERGAAAAAGAASPVRDGFSYRITRQTAAGAETVEVPESVVPAAVAQSVRDELI